MNDKECPICYETFDKYGKCTMTCNHSFCFKCIMLHFESKNTCAICRNELMPLNCRNQIMEKYKNKSQKNKNTNTINLSSFDLSSRRSIRQLLSIIEENVEFSNR